MKEKQSQKDVGKVMKQVVDDAALELKKLANPRCRSCHGRGVQGLIFNNQSKAWEASTCLCVIKAKEKKRKEEKAAQLEVKKKEGGHED